jgi:hypothetical protein
MMMGARGDRGVRARSDLINSKYTDTRQLTSARSIQAFVNVTWTLADLAVVFTYVKFGRAELPGFVTRRMFAAWGLLIFGVSYALQWLFFAKFGPHDAAGYSAFLQNTLMSRLFIQMVVARRGLRGQTLTIAVAKWLGTLAPTILLGVIEGSSFILGLGMICSVFDLVYIGFVLWFQRHPDGWTKDQNVVAVRVPKTSSQEQPAHVNAALAQSVAVTIADARPA